MSPHVCPWWFAYTFDHPLRRLVHRPEKMLAPYVRSGGTVVDIGCGMGFFSLGMARLVGPSGRVVSVDLQPQMLDVLHKRAMKAGLADRIERRLASPDDLHIQDMAGRIDFALAFWMLHEVPNLNGLLDQVRRTLKTGGRLLAVEPSLHVSRQEFADLVGRFKTMGWTAERDVAIRLSRSVLFCPPIH